MEVDKTTISDLGIFDQNDELSIFEQLDRTLTTRGREQLRRLFLNPLSKVEEIVDTQKVIQKIMENLDAWPGDISNGSILVIEKMYESYFDSIPANPGKWDAFSYKLIHGPDYSLLRYSIGHCFDFLRGMLQIAAILDDDNCPAILKGLIGEIHLVTDKPELARLKLNGKKLILTPVEILRSGHFLLYRFKHHLQAIMKLHARLDAWYSMAKISKEKKLAFPEFVESDSTFLQSDGLYHLLVPNAIPYDLHIGREKNFLFLTGANMAGKSTYIKSVGVAVFLAHTGMGVPAKKMQLTLFNGLLSNINVIDNLAKGESYFFNEVQRIKSTLVKINDGRKWLILIDELFKGTNIQDAMKCSSTVIEGLLKIRSSVFILSTHLYEIAEDLKQYPNIIFRYFETGLKNDELFFSYTMQDGVSKDRMGFLILKQQGVVDLIQKL